MLFSPQPYLLKLVDVMSALYWHANKYGTLVLKLEKIDFLLQILNSVILVRKRIIPTERLQPVGEVSTNFS
jgi:hypothetical protein